MSTESENIKIANLIRLSRKRRKKKLKRTHKSILGGGRKSISKRDNRSKSVVKNSNVKNSVSNDEDKKDEEENLEIDCEVISYGGVKYLLDKKNNIYSYPDENEQYFFVGKKVNDYIKFDKRYKDMIDSK